MCIEYLAIYFRYRLEFAQKGTRDKEYSYRDRGKYLVHSALFTEAERYLT